MKILFIQNKDDIKIITSFALILNGLPITTFYFYNKIVYKKTADIYEKEAGSLPVTAIIRKNASLFITLGSYLTRAAFIMETLIPKYNKISNYGMSIEGYNLIRGLPCKLILGFKTGAALWTLCIPVLLGMFIVL